MRYLVPWAEKPGGLQAMGCKESDTTKQAGTQACIQDSSKLVQVQMTQGV